MVKKLSSWFWARGPVVGAPWGPGRAGPPPGAGPPRPRPPAPPGRPSPGPLPPQCCISCCAQDPPPSGIVALIAPNVTVARCPSQVGPRQGDGILLLAIGSAFQLRLFLPPSRTYHFFREHTIIFAGNLELPKTIFLPFSMKSRLGVL